MKEEDLEGSFSVSLANLCSFMCCTHPRPKDEQIQLMKIQDTLDNMSKKMETFEKQVDDCGITRIDFRFNVDSLYFRNLDHLVPGFSTSRRRSVSMRSKSSHRDDRERDHLTSLAEEGSDGDDDDTFSTSGSSETSEGMKCS